jgi:hypothetical protein
MVVTDLAIPHRSVTFMPQRKHWHEVASRLGRGGVARPAFGRVFTFRSGWINLRSPSLRWEFAMISSLLAVALLWAPPPDPSIAARKAYSNCLNQFVKTTSEKKLAPTEFDTLIDTACPDKAASFRTIMVTADVKRGISRKTAEQGVEDELTDFRTSAKESYRLYFEPAAGQP